MGRKRKEYKPPPEPVYEGLIGKEIYFLGNCLFWLKEFNEGRETKERLRRTLEAIEGQCNSIKTKIQ